VILYRINRGAFTMGLLPQYGTVNVYCTATVCVVWLQQMTTVYIGGVSSSGEKAALRISRDTRQATAGPACSSYLGDRTRHEVG